MGRLRAGWLTGLLAWLALAAAAGAGELKDFESGVSKSGDNADSRAGGSSAADHHESFGEDLGDSLLMDFARVVAEATVAGMAELGERSLAREIPDAGLSANWPIAPRENGDALLPRLRLDSAYQHVDSRVWAVDNRLECGYALVAIQLRQTAFHEDAPQVDHLDLYQWHALYRMSLAATVEIDAGPGWTYLAGDGRHSGVSFTTPVLFHPTKYLGFEFRPCWSAIHGNPVRDYDLGLVGSWRYLKGTRRLPLAER